MYPTAAELLPGWVRTLWTVLAVLVLGVQIRYAVKIAGPVRRWYAAYAVMAAGMIVMYTANPMDPPDALSPAALVVLIVGVLGAIALAVLLIRGSEAGRWRGRTPWLLAFVDMVTLAYIQIPTAVRPVLVCVVFAAYLFVTIVMRLAAVVQALRGAPQRPAQVLVDPGGRSAPATGSDAGSTSESTPSTAAGPGGVIGPLSLAVLAAAMLYILSV